MGIKEIYEEMSDEELLERFKNFKDYREDGKKAIIEELRKRNLVGEEEIEKKLDGIKKYEEEKSKETQIIEENKSNYSKKYSTLTMSNASKFVMFFLLWGIIGINQFFFVTISAFPTLFWEKTKAQIINIEEIKKTTNRNHVEEIITLHKVSYKYKVNNTDYLSNRMYPLKIYDGSGAKHIAQNYKKGDVIQIYYDQKIPTKSVVYRYDRGNIWMFIFSIIFILIFIMANKKAERDFGTEFKKKQIVIVALVAEFIILILR